MVLIRLDGFPQSTTAVGQTNRVIEVIEGTECGAVPSGGDNINSGDANSALYFNVGGVCDNNNQDEGETVQAFQDIQIPISLLPEVQNGNIQVRYGVAMANHETGTNFWGSNNPEDNPLMNLDFFNSSGGFLGNTKYLSSTDEHWVVKTGAMTIPNNATKVRFNMLCEAQAGADSDCYFDEGF